MLRLTFLITVLLLIVDYCFRSAVEWQFDAADEHSRTHS